MGPWSSCLFLPAVFCFVTPQCSESRTQKLGHWDVFSSSLFGCFVVLVSLITFHSF